jgi:hypothetical protein
MSDDLELFELSDKTGDARTKEIWDWLMGRIHDQSIVNQLHALIEQVTPDLKAQGREDWVGGFSLAKRYRCTLESGEYVPLLYKFTYLLHSPLKKKFTTEQFEESFDDAVEYSCYLRPDETESEFIQYITAIKAN